MPLNPVVTLTLVRVEVVQCEQALEQISGGGVMAHSYCIEPGVGPVQETELVQLGDNGFWSHTSVNISA